MERTKLTYTVESNEPVLLEVVGVDGQRYDMSVRVAILQIAATGARNPDSTPQLEIQASLVTEMKPV